MIFSAKTIAQTKKLDFKIWRNNACIGFIKIEKNSRDLKTCYLLNSEIRVNMIISVTIVSNEKTIFENGKLSYSSVNRKVNNREKVNKKLELLNGSYKFYNGKTSNSKMLDSISTNLSSLYLFEPINTKNIFCDNHQSVCPIIKLGNSQYKVIFPDGNYNVFYYKNGHCIKVEVFNSYYHVLITPMT